MSGSPELTLLNVRSQASRYGLRVRCMSSLEERSSRGTNQNQAEHERSRFFALSPDLLCIAGFDGYFKHLNSVWPQTLGYANKELLSQPYMSFVHPDDQESTLGEARKLPDGHAV